MLALWRRAKKGAGCAELATASGKRLMDEGPEQGALFEIEGPDEDGCVWICSAKGRSVWCQNLGPKDEVAAVLSEWLGSTEYLENG